MSTKAKERKDGYFVRLMDHLQEYNKLFIVSCDMVGSKQIQNVRRQIRGKGDMLMGKNTMIRKCLRENMAEHPHLEGLLAYVNGNIGFIFIKDDFAEMRDILKENFIGASARPGVVAPIDVSIPAGPTSLQPTETSFFQALNISTKITKGAIEILADVDLITKGKKVSPGASALLMKMGIKPFTYGLEIEAVYDNGNVFDPAVLDITDADVLAGFQAGVTTLASVCLATDYPTLASVPHSFVNGYKNVLAIALSTDYCFPAAQQLKDILSDPAKLAALAAAGAAAAPAAGGAAPAAAAAAEPEEEEEEEEDMGFDLFD